jgi:acyl carrier protein
VTLPDDPLRAELFGPDPHTAVETLLVRELQAALLIEDDADEFPVDDSFFDLGLTSLRLMEVKQRVEAVLGTRIRATAVFNHATVTRLTDHLVDDVLPGLDGPPQQLVPSPDKPRNA